MMIELRNAKSATAATDYNCVAHAKAPSREEKQLQGNVRMDRKEVETGSRWSAPSELVSISVLNS